MESSEYPDGILTKGAGGETNIGITENGTVVVGFENKDRDGKIQIKIYKNEQWSNLADKNYPEGLVSLGKGSNVNIETKGEDIFVVFVESDYAEKVRLLSWSESQQKWNELSSQGFLSEKSGHEPTLIFDKKKKISIWLLRNNYNQEKTNPGCNQKMGRQKMGNYNNFSFGFC